MFAGFIVFQKTESSPIEHFNILGFIMVGFMLWCLYLVWKVKAIVVRKSAERETLVRAQ
jgi:hypothetical protein